MNPVGPGEEGKALSGLSLFLGGPRPRIARIITDRLRSSVLLREIRGHFR